jgi:hypothetical protein
MLKSVHQPEVPFFIIQDFSMNHYIKINFFKKSPIKIIKSILLPMDYKK